MNHWKKKGKHVVITMIIVLAIVVSGCTSGGTSDNRSGESSSNLPNFLVITTYDVGSVTYALSAALSEGITKKTGIKTRQRASGTEFGRIIPVRSGDAHFIAGTSNTVFFGNEGIGEFASMEWGPQGFRQVWAASTARAGLITTPDSGIKTPYDLKGKNYPYVVGGETATFTNEAALRFAGLTWDDVNIVELPGTGAVYSSILEGRTDAIMGGLSAPPLLELEVSRGIEIVEFPESDTEGWARLREFAPHFYPVKTDEGVGIQQGEMKELIGYAAPVFLTYDHLDDEIAYTFTKAIHESYDEYKDLQPDLPKFAIEEAITLDNMVAPFHEGSVKYLKEIGWWNDEFEAKQNQLLERENMLKELWDNAIVEAEEKGLRSGDFPQFWLEKRAGSLK